jgi:hypothetical protein
MASSQLAIWNVILAGLILLFVVVGGSQIIGPRCGKYLITDNSIEFVLFGRLRVWTAAFSDITDIRSVSLFEMSGSAPSLNVGANAPALYSEATAAAEPQTGIRGVQAQNSAAA